MGDSRKRRHPEDELEDGASQRIRHGEGAQDGISYLDTLTADAIENIIRFTSRRPRHRNWRAHVPPELALCLLNSESILASTSRNLFRSLEACPIRSGNETCLTVETDEGCTTDLPRILSVLQETLNELKISGFRFPQTWTRAITSRYPRLKSLSLDGNHGTQLPLAEVLSATSGSLEFLEFRVPSLQEEDVSAISEVGKCLKSLCLSLGSLNAQIDTLWESIGETLEELSIDVSEYQNVAIPSIMQHCKNLNMLSMRYIEDFSHNEVEALCKSLGDQLKSLTLELCGIDHLRLGRIASACRSASMKLAERDGCTPASLCAIGERASVVDIGPGTVEDINNNLVESLRQSGEKCKNLTGIHVYGEIPEAALRAFFHRPKPFLVHFKADYDFFRSPVEHVFETLASRVSSLEKLEFSGMLPPASVLNEFVESNPLMKTIRIIDHRGNCYCGSYSGDGYPYYDLRTAATIFLKFENLEELSMTCMGVYRRAADEDVQRNKGYANTCRGARYRNLTVKVCGYVYS